MSDFEIKITYDQSGGDALAATNTRLAQAFAKLDDKISKLGETSERAARAQKKFEEDTRAIPPVLTAADKAAAQLAAQIERLKVRASLDNLKASSDEYADALRGAEEAAKALAGPGLSATERAAQRLQREIDTLKSKAAFNDMKASSQEWAAAMREAERAAKALAGPGLTAAEQAAENLAREIESLKSKANLDRLKASSSEYAEAMRDAERAAKDLDRAHGKGSASVLEFAGKAAMGANAALELASKVAQAGQAFVEFANKGGEARRIAEQFSGDLIRLREASAGLVDDTTLQQYSLLGEKLGLTATEFEGLVARATQLYSQGLGSSVAENLATLTNPEIEAMKNLGIIIDTTQERYKDLTDAQRTVLVSREQSAIGIQAMADGLHVEGVAVEQAQVKLANFIGDLQVAAYHFLENSGALDGLVSILAGAQEWFERNRGTIQRLANAGVKVLGVALKALEPTVTTISMLVEGLSIVVAGAIDWFKDLGDTAGWLGDAIALLASPLLLAKEAGEGLARALFGGAYNITTSAEAAIEEIEKIKTAADNAAQGIDGLKESVDVVSISVDDYISFSLQLQKLHEDVGGGVDFLAVEYVEQAGSLDKARTEIQKYMRAGEAMLDQHIKTRNELQAQIDAIYQVNGWNDQYTTTLTNLELQLDDAEKSVSDYTNALRDLQAVSIALFDLANPIDDDDDAPPKRAKERTLTYAEELEALEKLIAIGRAYNYVLREHTAAGLILETQRDRTRRSAQALYELEMAMRDVSATLKAVYGEAAVEIFEYGEAMADAAGLSSRAMARRSAQALYEIEMAMRDVSATLAEMFNPWVEAANDLGDHGILGVLWGIFDPEDHIDNLTRVSDALADTGEQVNAMISSMEGFEPSSFKQQFDAVSSSVQRLSKDLPKIAEEWEKWGTAQQNGWKLGGQAAATGIAAIGAASEAYIDDIQVKAGFNAAEQFALMWGSYPDPAGMAAHGISAVQFLALASGALGSTGRASNATANGASMGLGASGAVSPATFAPTSADQRRDFEETRETTILQLQVDEEVLARGTIRGANKGRARWRSSERLDDAVIGGRGRMLRAS